MRLGFDFDGVLTAGTYFDLSQIPDDINERLKLYNTLPPMDANAAGIWKALVQDHEVFIITARGSGSQSGFKQSLQSVLTWMEWHGFVLPRGIISGIRKSTKLQLVEAMDLDVLIDDSPENFDGWNPTYHVEPLLMNNPSYPANQDCHDYVRVYDWLQLERHINERNAAEARN